ncbi:DUF397 domain-containing protein [Streptomyces sp. SID7909]|uniref:DUF397 domain-containing protein n=1 Tax=Streptomyces sp. SID7909 TaxID=2706092 RepID=UPI0013BCBF1F|nr:DUF397 domain-containing protein [Streptomyces sp. SID7909]NEC10203.1 DUF397 domain-containing protein [Streptomyces sp. SID7909]
MKTTDAAVRQELVWVKSSYSGAEGGECVEVAWRKSSYSTGNGGECVEFAATAACVHIRDSKQTSGPVLSVASAAWSGFVGLVTS